MIVAFSHNFCPCCGKKLLVELEEGDIRVKLTPFPSDEKLGDPPETQLPLNGFKEWGS